jgi:hypothetical protein
MNLLDTKVREASFKLMLSYLTEKVYQIDHVLEKDK